MSDEKYKDWESDKLAILEFYSEFSSISKEALYQDFKRRLAEEAAHSKTKEETVK